MTEKEYYKELGKIRGSRLNKIIYAVNCKVDKSEIELETEVESMFYDSLVSQADEHMKKYGFYPTFDMFEIESDDPVLDIYRDEV